MIFNKKTPIELFNIASAGGRAQTVSEVMGDVLNRELNILLSQFASTKPDLGQYSYLAGQIKMLQSIIKSIELEEQEGQEAVNKIRKEGVWRSQ